MFERFRRGGSPHEVTGAGLGLPIVAAAARQLGAVLEIQPGLHGRGLCFDLEWQTELPGACRTFVVDSEHRPHPDRVLPDSPPHGCSMGQEAGEKGSAAVDLQPTIPKPDRLLNLEAGHEFVQPPGQTRNLCGVLAGLPAGAGIGFRHLCNLFDT